MEKRLLKPREVDLIFRYPSGRTLRLAKVGRIPCIRLPDGEIRFEESEIEKLLAGGASEAARPAHAAEARMVRPAGDTLSGRVGARHV
jgi:hypothetical protein